MKTERDVIVEGTSYCVVISDEQEALLAAKAAGRAFVGVWEEIGAEEAGGVSVPPGVCPDWLWEADYVTDSPEAADDRFLERVVRRMLGLPWIIAESERIYIRELTAGDVEQMAELSKQERMGTMEMLFSDPDRLNAYVEHQYGFYEYGIWAVVSKTDGRIVGTAGVSDGDARRWARENGVSAAGQQGSGVPETEPQMELGYCIFGPYRRQGFAEEACRLILDYVEQEYGCPVYAVVMAENTASVRLLDKLGFCLCGSYRPSPPDWFLSADRLSPPDRPLPTDRPSPPDRPLPTDRPSPPDRPSPTDRPSLTDRPEIGGKSVMAPEYNGSELLRYRYVRY